jgi:hypothetical protein
MSEQIKMTKEWVEKQAQALNESILKNQGALNLLSYMLQNKLYVEETPKPEGAEEKSNGGGNQ